MSKTVFDARFDLLVCLREGQTRDVHGPDIRNDKLPLRADQDFERFRRVTPIQQNHERISRSDDITSGSDDRVVGRFADASDTGLKETCLLLFDRLSLSRESSASSLGDVLRAALCR